LRAAGGGRGYYALGDRLTPLKIGAAAVALNMARGRWTLVWRMADAGLANVHRSRRASGTASGLNLLCAAIGVGLVGLAADAREGPSWPPWEAIAACNARRLGSGRAGATKWAGSHSRGLPLARGGGFFCRYVSSAAAICGFLRRD